MLLSSVWVGLGVVVVAVAVLVEAVLVQVVLRVGDVRLEGL